MFDIYVTILIVIHFVRSTPHIVQLFMKGWLNCDYARNINFFDSP